MSGHREVEGRERIQTDANVNLQSSGGTLLDAFGIVHGIISAKTFGIGFGGIAFGVPVSVASRRLRIEWADAR